MTVTGTQVRRAGYDRLRAALPGVLAQLEARDGLPLPAPRSWGRLPDFTRITEQQSPAVLVTSPGLEAAPEERRLGEFHPVWLLRAFCVVRGRGYDETADRVGQYVAGLRVALLSDRTLGGLADDAQWRAESYSELDTDQARTVGAGSVTVAYRIPTDLQLAVPPPGAPDLLVQSVEVTTVPLPLPGP